MPGSIPSTTWPLKYHPKSRWGTKLPPTKKNIWQDLGSGSVAECKLCMQEALISVPSIRGWEEGIRDYCGLNVNRGETSQVVLRRILNPAGLMWAGSMWRPECVKLLWSGQCWEPPGLHLMRLQVPCGAGVGSWSVALRQTPLSLFYLASPSLVLTCTSSRWLLHHILLDFLPIRVFFQELRRFLLFPSRLKYFSSQAFFIEESVCTSTSIIIVDVQCSCIIRTSSPSTFVPVGSPFTVLLTISQD